MKNVVSIESLIMNRHRKDLADKHEDIYSRTVQLLKSMDTTIKSNFSYPVVAMFESLMSKDLYPYHTIVYANSSARFLPSFDMNVDVHFTDLADLSSRTRGKLLYKLHVCDAPQNPDIKTYVLHNPEFVETVSVREFVTSVKVPTTAPFNLIMPGIAAILSMMSYKDAKLISPIADFMTGNIRVMEVIAGDHLFKLEIHMANLVMWMEDIDAIYQETLASDTVEYC